MAERLQGFFYSETGTVWLVKIFDSSYVGATTDFDCESIKFNYTPTEEEDRFSPIISSECRIRLIVNNATLEGLMDDLETAEEGRFVLALSNIVGLGNTVAWNGYIMPDQIVRDDVPLTPGYTVEIKAKDGLNWLKNVDYSDGGTPYSSATKETFNAHILNCLTKLTDLTALYTSGQTFLNVVCNWHEDSWTYASSINPLIRSRIRHGVFTFYDSRGNFVIPSCYDVLVEICKAWGARIMFSGTAYWFVQLNEYRSPTSKTVFQYTKTGSASTATGQDLTIFHDPASGSNEATRFSGGNFRFYPALKRVEVDYEHISSQNYLPGQVWDNSNETAFTVADIDDNALTSSFVINALLSVTSNYVGASFNYHFVIFRFVLNVGTSWLKREATWTGGVYTYGQTSWEGTLQYYDYVVPKIFRFDPETIGPIQIAFETPANIQSGDLLFNFDYYQSRFVTGAVITALDINITYSLSNVSLEFVNDGVLANQNDINRYSADNTAMANVERNVKTRAGDGPTKTNPTHIEVLNDASAWVLSDGWKVGNTGSAVAFSKLLVEAIISGQDIPVKRFGQASLRSTDPDGNPIIPHIALNYASAYWVFQQGVYDVGSEIMSGQWWKMQTGTAFAHNSVEFLPRGQREEGPPSAGGRPGGGTTPEPIGDGTAKQAYHQRFSNHSSATLTITANGGLIPTAEAQYLIFINGQFQSPDYFSVSGSVITLTFTPVSKQIDVIFWYP